jgi:hypothetical protein
MATDPRPTLDEMLRRFLEADPNDGISKLRLAIERCAEAITEHTVECEKYRREVDARFLRLEQRESMRPATMHDLGKLVTSTGSWDTREIDKVIEAREAKAALEQRQALLKRGGQIATALLIAVLIFAGGSFWRDLWGPRPATTNITTIAPGAAGK